MIVFSRNTVNVAFLIICLLSQSYIYIRLSLTLEVYREGFLFNRFAVCNFAKKTNASKSQKVELNAYTILVYFYAFIYYFIY